MKRGEHSPVIAIAGAGIAGLSAAIALTLAGFPVEIFEREAKLEPIGAGIQLGPNATRILERWKVAFTGASCEPDTLELRNARTGLLNSIPLRRMARTRYGAPYITLLRADLQAALLTRAAELGIGISFGCPVTALNETERLLRIDSGSASFNAAALIGADGINSTVRQLDSSVVHPSPARAVAWRAILPLSAVPAVLAGSINVWMSPGAHLVHYPVSGGACLNAVLIVDESHQISASATAPPFLRNRFSSWAELPRSMIASTEAWQAWRIYEVAKWTGGERRIQSIGDAWHAMRPYLASGAVMAIEDADALASSLTETEGKIEAGLKLFRERREPRVWHVARASAMMGRLYHCPRPFDTIRDLAIKTLTGSMLLARNDWLYGPRL